MSTEFATLLAAVEEFNHLHDEFLTLQQQIESDEPDDAFEQYFLRLTLLSETAMLLSLEGMAACVEKLSENLMMIDPESSVEEQLPGFYQWLDHAKAHLNDPAAVEPCIAWVNLLEDEQWPSPLEVFESREVIGAFAQAQVVDDEDSADDDAPEYVLDELSIQISEGTDMEVLEAFLVDTPNQMEALFSLIGTLDFNAVKAQHLPSFQAAQRISHTIKGSANLVGVTAIAWLAHELESFFEFLMAHCERDTDHALSFDIETSDVVLASVDAMQSILDAIQNESEDESDYQTWLPQLSGWNTWRYETHPLNAQEHTEVPAEPTEESQPATEAATTQASQPEATEPEPTKSTSTVEFDQQEWVELVEEMSINLAQSQELFKRVNSGLGALKDNDLRIQERRFELENAVDSRSMAQVNQTDLSAEFDSLELDRYDDIHRTAHQFIETVSDNREMVQTLQDQVSSFDGLIRQQRRYTEQFQHQVLQSGQQPFAHLSSRLQRCVRQAARFTSKQVDLFIAGDDLKVDRAIVNALADPLMHLLRNAVDHGIEIDRDGKKSKGRIELSFTILQRAVEITVRDDGEGIDADRILAKAQERNMALTDAHLADPLQLLFAPGFTTRKEVTQLSGRGIGLDAVATDVSNLDGTIKVESHTGIGTLFTLTIPLRQVTRHMIIVTLGDQQFALDSTRIAQIIPPDESSADKKGEQWVVNWQDDWVPFREIHSHLGAKPYRFAKGELRHPLLLIEHQNKPCAIPIDSLQNSFDLVLKPLGHYVPAINGLFGMTQTGDGTLMPVLNLNELLTQNQAMPASRTINTPITKQQTVLVVDDSLSVRNSLKLLLGDSGFKVSTATDGLDALEKIREQTPAIVLVDMEMPRMNGLELTQALRARTDTEHLPIVMITSRSHAKHREQAKAAGVDDYLTKPFNENQVVDMVHQRMSAAAHLETEVVQ